MRDSAISGIEVKTPFSIGLESYQKISNIFLFSCYGGLCKRTAIGYLGYSRHFPISDLVYARQGFCQVAYTETAHSRKSSDR